MKVVYKHGLIITSTQTVHAPINWKPLSIQIQRDRIVLWELRDKDAPEVEHVIVCVGTGNEIDPDTINPNKHLGTVQVPGGYVYHFFLRF